MFDLFGKKAKKQRRKDKEIEEKFRKELEVRGIRTAEEHNNVYAYNFEPDDASFLTNVDVILGDYYIKLNEIDNKRKCAEVTYKNLVKQTKELESYVKYLQQRKQKLISIEIKA